MLARPRLTQQLRRPLQEAPTACPNQRRSRTLLTIITAPAGYGKSTLLSEWLHQERELGIGWLSLAISALLFVAAPTVNRYVGLSGVLHGLFVLGLVPMARSGDRVAMAGLLLLFAKLAECGNLEVLVCCFKGDLVAHHLVLRFLAEQGVL